MSGSFVYAVTLFELCVMEMKKKKKESKIEEIIEIFAFNFLNYDEKHWNSGNIFYIRVVNGFHLNELSFISLCLSKRCSYTLSTGRHCNPPIPV